MKYFKLETDMPYYDNMLKNPDYFRRAKGKKFTIKHMSPTQYLSECAKQQNTSLQTQYNRIIPEYVQKYKSLVLSGSPMPLPIIESTEYAHTQEGRHRAVVAKELKLKTIPVMVITDIEDKI